MLYKATYFSPVGKITLASDGDNIIGLWLEGQKYYGGTLTEKCITRENIPVFLSAKAWLDKYFAGERIFRFYQKVENFDRMCGSFYVRFRTERW